MENACQDPLLYMEIYTLHMFGFCLFKVFSVEKVGTLIMKDVYDHNLTLHFSNQSEKNSEDIRIGGCHWKCPS